MPVYEYRCLNCGNEEEAIVRIENSNVPMLCPKCYEEMIKLVSKGTGFKIKGYNADNNYGLKK